MTNYKLGCNFDNDLIERVSELNLQHTDRRITEFFGSDRAHAILAARPDFRLPAITMDCFEWYVQKCNDHRIEFNYTMNSILPGTKSYLIDNKKEIIQFVKTLEKIGVKRITIGNPILLDFVREASLTIGIEISTIMHVDAITQVKYFKEQYNIDKVCGNLAKNRSLSFTQKMAEYCNSIGVKYDLMVNEFCITGGERYSTHCVFRDSCYLVHATTSTKEEALSMNGYPMGYCMTSRKTHPANWLRARFIRPEDIKQYNKIGVHDFKITGRTGTTDQLIFLAKAYLEESLDGNLLKLWKPLETIYTDQKESEFVHPTIIDNKKLDSFMDHWFMNKEFYCEEEVCGDTCKYCEDFYERIK